jgi:hypothetical protein
MARSPAALIHPKDPVLAPLRPFLDWVRRRLDTELPELLTAVKGNWNPPSVADGASTSTTVEVPGVGFYAADGTTLVAMPALVAITQALPAGCSLTAAVTDKNEVTVSLLNLSGSAQNIGTIAETRVAVWRYGA